MGVGFFRRARARALATLVDAQPVVTETVVDPVVMTRLPSRPVRRNRRTVDRTDNPVKTTEAGDGEPVDQ